MATEPRPALVRPGEPAFGSVAATPAGRARRAVAGRLSRVRAPLVWRVLYGLLGSRALVAATAASLRLVGRARAEAALARFRELFVSSGWPYQAPGWVNLDCDRFAWRIERRLAGAADPPARRAPTPREARLRVGVAGELSALHLFSAAHFAGTPPEVEPVVFDLEYYGRHAGYVAATGVEYHALGDFDDTAVAAVNEAGLDVLLPFLGGPDRVGRLDRVTTPCIADVQTTSAVLQHPSVSFRIVVQPEADYFVRGGRLFCATSRRPFDDVLSLPGRLVYDTRDVREKRVVPWLEREPLLVFHGALYKLASEPFLDLVLGLLAEDEALEFVVMGSGKVHEPRLAAIRAAAAARGLAGRVHYDGAYARYRDETGARIADAGWERLASHLRRARLAPNPWPIGGAAARVEAYLLGAPTVHLALRTDPESWGKPQHTTMDVPALHVPAGTATDPAGYRELCLRCLYDGAFADGLAADQLAVAAAVTDPGPFWAQVVAGHARWLAGA